MSLLHYRATHAFCVLEDLEHDLVGMEHILREGDEDMLLAVQECRKLARSLEEKVDAIVKKIEAGLTEKEPF